MSRLSPTNNNQEGAGLTISILLTMVEEKLILAFTDPPVIYDTTLQGYHDQYPSIYLFLCCELSTNDRRQNTLKGMPICYTFF